jgi:hypothetical protein
MDYNFAALCYSRMVDYAIVEWIQILLDYAIVYWIVILVDYAIVEWMDHAIVEWIILFSAITNYGIMTSRIIGYSKIIS